MSRAEAGALLSPVQMSFMGESRRLENARMKRELGLRLHHPTVREGLAPLAAGAPAPSATPPERA